MPQKRYRPEEIIAKLREAEVLLGQGKKVPEVIKAIGYRRVAEPQSLEKPEKESEPVQVPLGTWLD